MFRKLSLAFALVFAITCVSVVPARSQGTQDAETLIEFRVKLRLAMHRGQFTCEDVQKYGPRHQLYMMIDAFALNCHEFMAVSHATLRELWTEAPYKHWEEFYARTAGVAAGVHIHRLVQKDENGLKNFQSKLERVLGFRCDQVRFERHTLTVLNWFDVDCASFLNASDSHLATLWLALPYNEWIHSEWIHSYDNVMAIVGGAHIYRLVQEAGGSRVLVEFRDDLNLVMQAKDLTCEDAQPHGELYPLYSVITEVTSLDCQTFMDASASYLTHYQIYLSYLSWIDVYLRIVPLLDRAYLQSLTDRQ